MILSWGKCFLGECVSHEQYRSGSCGVWPLHQIASLPSVDPGGLVKNSKTKERQTGVHMRGLREVAAITVQQRCKITCIRNWLYPVGGCKGSNNG